MLREGSNSSRFSPKRSENTLAEEYKRELELVKKELENEKLRTQDARKKCASEIKRYKETFQREKRKLADDLKSKSEQQRTREIQQLKDSVLRERELEIKHLMRWKDEELRELQTLLQKERDTAVRQARELQKQLIDELLSKGHTSNSSNTRKHELDLSSASECQCRLQDVLSRIRWEHDGEQAARIRHLKLELELARNLFIKYILDSNSTRLLTILKAKSKPLNCGEIKFGRYSLGSRTTRTWSLDEVSTGLPCLENIAARPQSHEGALFRARSLECMFPEHESPHANEQLWKLTSQVETLEIQNVLGCHENHILDDAPCLDTENDFLTWQLFVDEVNDLCENTKGSCLDISAVTGGNDCTTSIEMLDSNQSHGAQSVDSLLLSPEVELSRKRKECELLEQEVTKKQKRCEELEIKLQEVQTENACLVEEKSRLCIRVKRAAKVESENADLKRHLAEVTEQRDSALEEIHRLQSKLENLEQVLKHMRDVVERRQQLEKDHEDAVTALQKRQEEVKRLQQAQVEAKKEHEGAVQLLESTLDTLQSKVKLLEEKCRSQTEQFSLLSQELERFRLQTGNIDLLTSTLVTSELPPPQCCSTPGLSPVQQERGDVNNPVLLTVEEKVKDEEKKQTPEASNPSHNVGSVEVPSQPAAKTKRKLELPHTPSKSESTHDSSKSCPTPEVDTASEMEDLEADSVSLNPEPETRSSAKLQVFLARYSYNPFDGPNENPEAELPLTAGEYIYVYGDMDDDGFYEGELMDGRRGLVPSNFVERVSDDDLIACHPAETNELSQSSGQDISFLSGSSIERSEDDDDPSSLSPLPMQGNSEGARDVSAVPYPRKLTLIKQLARSIVVGWDPPLVAAGSGNILSYNIYVDNELRQNVRCGGQTKALIEKLELKTRTYRISVQSMTDSGCSDRMRCTLLVGHGYSLAPTQLRVRSLSATSAEITWQPCNSNYSHALYLNEESCGLAKAGTYWYTFSSLRPSTMYNVKVEARPQRIPLELPLERREPKTTVMQLTTPAAGPPDAPLDVQVELGPKPGVLLITWLPVTIDAAGTSNGVRVTGYAVYADGQKVLEVTSPTAGSVLVGTSHLQLLQVSREISVRTMSPSGESLDSVPAHIPSAFLKVPDSPSLSHTFSNTSLICEQASGQNLSSHSEKFPSMPLTSSSPCSLHNPPASTSQANSSTHTNCIRGDCIDSLPVQVLSLSASSGYCQVSSSLEPAEILVSCQGTQDKVPSSVPEAPRPEHTLQPGTTELQEHSREILPNTKEPEIDDKVNTSGLPRGITWCKENSLEVNTTAKEECSSPETGLPEEAETTNLSCRGVSINDFLEVDRNETKESSVTNVSYETEDAVKLQLDTHSSVHLDHSRSSNLSDILEEEEDVEEEDCNVVPSAKKWGQPPTSTGVDSSVKENSIEDGKMQLQLSPTEYIASNKKNSSSRPISDSESDAAYSTHPECSQEKILDDKDCPAKDQEADSVRLFVALFDYDPETMSPNPDAYMEELPFKEGQILQVFGDKDSDGFYHGKCAERTGYIPCNMVSELHIESEEVRMQLLRQGHLTSASLLIDLVQRASAPEEDKTAGIQPKTSQSDLSTSMSMVAIFDYNPKESSPNLDAEAELSFTAGDVITVFGPMDEDGFYYGELNGRRGLVPSNYLELSHVKSAESTCPETVHKRGEKEFRFDAETEQSNSLPFEPKEQAVESKKNCEKADLHQGIACSTKKKKSFFSKGRKLFKKLGSSGKNL
ncbi:peripheral-type benzodiazepine receptor-associated protein 1 isoform X5 [Dendropsophus ebraccatus]|uniref:peripheral-type benzodiazepine receptor-associated protein 1 isoform X5 n=1 Tax=Dendropsophus ebraccatus TaxID=150705 RepID=UPI0038317891